MKSIILFVLSLLLILEKQAAVMGQKGGSKGQLSSGSSRFPHRHRSQHYSGQKDKQHTESKGSFSIQHTYHVDANDHDRTQKSQQYYLNAQHKTTKSERHLGRSQRLLNYKLKGRDRVKPKRHFHLIVIHRKGGQVHHGTQNPSQDQGNSPSGKGIYHQYSNTEERLRVRGLSKEQASASGAPKSRTQVGSQTNYVLQTEELVANKQQNKQQRETQNSHRNKGHYQNVFEVREEHSSKLQTSLRPAHQHRLQHGSKDIFTTQDKLLVYNKNQHQTKNLDQDQEHGRKAHKVSYQSSSTEERRLNSGEKGIQKGVPKGSISIQTEEKIYGKSQNQVTIPSQDQEHGHKENKISYQSSSAEERRLNSGEKGIQKGVPKGSISIQTEEKIYGKSQNQVTIPSQDQENGHKENKISYQSSSTEERRLNSGEKGIQKGVPKGSISIQTEEKIYGKSQNQLTIPSQDQEHGHKENKISYQSSSTEERRLNSGEKGIQRGVPKGSISIQTEEKIYGKSQNQVTIPSQDQEHGHKENKISYQSSSTEERQLNCGEKGIQKGVSKGGISIQTEKQIHGESQNQVTISNQDQEHVHKENKISYQSSSTEERRLNSGEKDIQKGVSKGSTSIQTEEKIHGKSQNQATIPSQDQEHGHKEYKISYQSSSTEERRLNSGEKGIQKGVSKGNISIQTEEKIHGKSQNQVKIPSQDQEHGHKENKISYQSSSTEERRLNSGEKGIQKGVSKGSISIQTEEKIHGKSQNQVKIPSQDQEHGHKENKISYQSSSTEERRLNSGEKGIQKGVSKGSISIQTEEKIYGKSQNQVTIPSQDQEHGHKENKIAYQSSSTEERQLNYGGKSIQKDVSQSSLSFQTEKLVEGKSQIQTSNPNQDQWSGQNAKGNSGKSADREQDLLSHEQEGRYQQEFSGAHNTVNIEHEVAYDDLLTQQYNEDRNPIST
uniref:Semenogelin-2 n=1 Tax=Chlorocebus aethiops TaxID=9534 RepID=A4K2Y7_CHLAE|nr:semenogelin II precursor [Chlorocebus aethiops]